MKQNLHITHNDLDGAGCGIILQKTISDIETKYLDYTDVNDVILESIGKYKKIYISDVTPDLKTLEILISKADFFIIDHHKTNMHLKGKDYAIFDTNKCATLLAYEWACKINKNLNIYYPLVELINDFDLWLNKHQKSKELNILFTFLGLNKFVSRFIDNPSINFDSCEELIIDIEKNNLNDTIEDVLHNSRILKDVYGNTFSLSITDKYNSETGDYLLNKLDVDYVLMINPKHNKVSLRSRGNFDVSAIATNFGGGGHKNAAGFRISFTDKILEILDSIGLTKSK
ncbi:MAG: DHHA1 domain-containing protein [Deferribacterota bacterium]|nr:DHHA1 domain-containing protein [Deferribacterota bacterium]